MESNTQKKQLPAFLILTIISVVAALVLALTNMVTAGPIAEHAMAALKEAFSAVMPADSYEEMTVPEGYEVSSLYAAKQGDQIIGYCVTASGTGYGGPVAVTLGVGTDGVVTGCQVGDTSFAETAGFGMRAKDESFQAQFAGISAISGGSFEALSGATVTSEAVRAAANKGLRCVAEMALGQSPVADPLVTFGKAAEKPAADIAVPNMTAQVVSAPGFNGADVSATVSMNTDGSISGITLDLSQQLPPVCDMVNTEEFLNQFIGKTGPFVQGENVDIVSGATFTSEGVINALNSLYASSPDEKTVTAPGFNGADVGVTVALNADGTIADITLDLSQQLPPVCDMVNTEEFLNQFIGKTGPFVQGENVDIVSGATFTSEGVINALNSLYEAAGDSVTVSAPGFNSADVGVTVTLNEDGTIAAITLDLSQQLPPVCDMVNTEEFLNQFIGKTGPFVQGENVDIVSGATFTSEGVINALNSLYK